MWALIRRHQSPGQLRVEDGGLQGRKRLKPSSTTSRSCEFQQGGSAVGNHVGIPLRAGLQTYAQIGLPGSSGHLEASQLLLHSKPKTLLSVGSSSRAHKVPCRIFKESRQKEGFGLTRYDNKGFSQAP